MTLVFTCGDINDHGNWNLTEQPLLPMAPGGFTSQGKSPSALVLMVLICVLP